MMHLKLCTPTHHRATDQSFGPVTVALMATEKQSEASEATRPTGVKEFVFDDDGHYYVDLSKDPMRSMIEEDELEGDPSSDQLSNSTTGDSSSDSDDDHQATDQSLGSVTVALMATETKSDASEATKPTVANEFVFDDDGHYDVGMIEEDDQFVVLMQSMIEEDEPEGGSPSVQPSGSTEYKASPYNVEVGKDTMRAQLDKARKPTCATAMQASNVADYYMTKYLSKAQEALGPVPRLFIRTSFNNLGESRWSVHRMLQLAGRPTHRCLECLSRRTTMKRFHDETLVSILQKMRQSGGCILTREEKKALRNTDVSKKTAEEQRRRLANTELWYQAAPTWATVAMAQVIRSRLSAVKAGATLYVIPAKDFVLNRPQNARLTDEYLAECISSVPNMNTTGRLPSIALLHIGMIVRLTNTVESPEAVTDSTGEIVGIDEAHDEPTDPASRHTSDRPAIRILEKMPVVTVKLHEVDTEYLPPLACEVHAATGAMRECPQCDFRAGCIAVEAQQARRSFPVEVQDPMTDSTYTIQAQRVQLPLTIKTASTIHTLQGTTAEPGIIFHWKFPRFFSAELRWLATYVALSRPPSLKQLISVDLPDDIEALIQGGPPEGILSRFDDMFKEKELDTHEKALELMRQLGWNMEA